MAQLTRDEQDRSPFIFFALVFALTIPFWILGVLTSRQLLPALPISALAVICPVSAAAILEYRRRGWPGVGALLKRSFDFARKPSIRWLIITLFIQPLIMLLSFVVMRLAGTPVPNPQIALLPALIMFAVFFIGALGEELGWSGYATDPLQERFGALGASLIIGLVWVVWHFIGLAQANRSLEFIAWWSLGTLAYRVLIVWLYNQSGRSVFIAAIFHSMSNETWQLFPVNGSFYDPRITGLITAAIAILIVIGWGSKALTRHKIISTNHLG